MYRLPNQFDPAGRQDEVSAAGGGSTSSCCCSCIVTLGSASVITAIKFAALVPAATPAATSTSASASAPSQEQAPEDPPIKIDTSDFERPFNSADQVMPRWQRATLGALALIIAIALGSAGSLSMPAFGLFVFVAVYVGIFCFVYDKSRLPTKRGALVGILALIAILACGALELWLWIALVFS